MIDLLLNFLLNIFDLGDLLCYPLLLIVLCLLNIISNFLFLGLNHFNFLKFSLGFKNFIIELFQLFHIAFLLLGGLGLQLIDIGVDSHDILVTLLGRSLGLFYLIQNQLVLRLDVLLDILDLAELIFDLL